MVKVGYNSKLTENFKLSEFMAKEDYEVLASSYVFPFIVENIYRLAVLLEKIRKTSIQITSGYRTPAHNEKVGGAKNSLHLYGMACDFITRDLDFDYLQKLVEWREIGELILYIKQNDPKYLRFHISIPSFNLQKFGVVLLAEEGRKSYQRVEFRRFVEEALKRMRG